MMCRRFFMLALLLPTACAMHKIQYYEMSVPATPSSPNATATNGVAQRPSIAVERFSTVQALQDSRIRYRKGPNEVGTYEYHRWSDPPAVLVREALAHALQASGSYSSVTDARSTGSSDFVVRGKLIEFSELDSTGIQTRVSLDLSVYEQKSGHLVWTGTLSQDEPVNGKGFDAIVQSMERNLNSLLAQAASGIRLATKNNGPPADSGSGAPALN